MRCVIYARVSTNREEQQNSLANQINLGETIANTYNFEVVDHYIDNGISGAGIKNRVEIQRLIEDAKKKKFDVVIAKSVSRFGRNTIHSLQTAFQLESAQIRLILPEDNYDTLTSDGPIMFHLKAVLAEHESAKLSERIKLGLQASARQGKRRTSISPYGYAYNSVTKSLEIDEETAPIVREIFDLYLNKGRGMFTISNYLTTKHIPTPRAYAGVSNAGTRWQQSTIKTILTNPVYLGNLVFCREETTKTLSESELFKLRRKVDTDKQIIIDNAHPALVSIEDFESVKTLMKTKSTHKSNGKESLFSYLLVCPDCGSGMHFKPDRRKGAYVCGGYVRYTSKYCSSHIIGENDLLEAIKGDLMLLVKDSLYVKKLYGVAEDKIKSIQNAKKNELLRVQKSLSEINKKFDTLLTLHINGDITLQQFKHQNEQIVIQQDLLNKRKAELSEMIESHQYSSNQLNVLKKEIERFLNLDIDDVEVMKNVLKRIISKIEVFEGERIKIHYNISNPLTHYKDTV